MIQENGTIEVGFQPEGMHGGALLAVRGTDLISFFDWEKRVCVRRIDVTAENIFWNSAGDMLAIGCKDSVFVLKYHRDVVSELHTTGGDIDDDGIEEAFEVVTEVRNLEWPMLSVSIMVVSSSTPLCVMTSVGFWTSLEE